MLCPNNGGNDHGPLLLLLPLPLLGSPRCAMESMITDHTRLAVATVRTLAHTGTNLRSGGHIRVTGFGFGLGSGLGSGLSGSGSGSG